MSNSAKQYSAEEEAAMRARSRAKDHMGVRYQCTGFKEACAQESRLLAEADARDPTIASFSEAALRDLAEELDRLEK